MALSDAEVDKKDSGQASQTHMPMRPGSEHTEIRKRAHLNTKLSYMHLNRKFARLRHTRMAPYLRHAVASSMAVANKARQCRRLEAQHAERSG